MVSTLHLLRNLDRVLDDVTVKKRILYNSLECFVTGKDRVFCYLRPSLRRRAGLATALADAHAQ